MPAADVEPCQCEDKYELEVFENHYKYKSVERWYDDEGLLHRDNDLPAEIYISKQNDKILIQRWYKHGVLHRDGDLPAVIKVEYDDEEVYEKYKIWYKDGLKHRDNGKPAFKFTCVNIYRKHVYYINGTIKNIDESKPAYLIIHNEGAIDSTWYIDGKKGRADDLPAFESRNGQGILENVQWYSNDLLHRNNDEPAIIKYDEEYDVYNWYKFGKRYRENDKPTSKEVTKDGKPIYHSWFDDKFRFHRLNGPARIEYYPDTGIIKKEMWYIDDHLHREDNKPAKRSYYKNGVLKKESYYIKHKLGRTDNLPVRVWYNKNGTLFKFQK